jgi:PAS domain S-box-containing protein
MSSDGTVRDWNPAAERLFGYTHAEAVGHELAELVIPHALRDRHRAALARFVETGQATIIDRRLELFALRANGKLVPVELTVTIVPDSDPPMFAGFVRDQSTA